MHHLNPKVIVELLLIPVAADEALHLFRIIRPHGPAVTNTYARPFLRNSEPKIIVVELSPSNSALDSPKRLVDQQSSNQP